MSALHQEFAAGLAETARGDIEGAFVRALRKGGLTGPQNRALANLRDRCLTKLERMRDGSGDRLPASVLDEALEGIHRVLNGDPKAALAKRAGGPGHRGAALADARPQGEALTEALVAVAKEFKELAQLARKAFKNIGAEDRFDEWEQRNHFALSEALHKQDLQTAQIVLDKARRTLGALLDQAQVDAAIGEPGEKLAALIPNYHPFR